MYKIYSFCVPVCKNIKIIILILKKLRKLLLGKVFPVVSQAKRLKLIIIVIMTPLTRIEVNRIKKICLYYVLRQSPAVRRNGQKEKTYTVIITILINSIFSYTSASV